jgi:hypothetical protein
MRLGTKVQSNSRIQFASNQSKLVPRELDLGPSAKVGLRQQGACHTTVALPFTLKCISRQNNNYGNSNISPCETIIFKNLL